MTSTKARAISKTAFVATLPKQHRAAIRAKLEEYGYSTTDIDNAMCSRVCDLEETIPIYAVLRAC